MTNLTDTQCVLLSSAAARDNGSLCPLPDTLTAPKPAIAKSIASLQQRGLVEERETGEAASVHRTDGDLRYGVFITDAGLAAIGAGEAPSPAPADNAATTPSPAAPKPARSSKTEAVIALLTREVGATMAELIAATGWLPHTTRAALTGLRKKGHVIERTKRGEETCYRIAGASA
jgi:hypothetical protein